MSATITGKIFFVSDVQAGTSNNGKEWEKRSFAIETQGDYPKQVYLTVWGDKHKKMPFDKGNIVECSYDPQSRQYNDKWYTELNCYKVELKAPAMPQSHESSGHLDYSQDAPDDLPF